MIEVLGTFNKFPALRRLPALLKKHQRVAKKLRPVKAWELEEKALRQQMHGLLLEAGIPAGEGVTCAGYDVDRQTKRGNSYISRDLLLAAGVAPELIDACVDRYASADFVLVSPVKGAAVAA